MCDTCIVNNGDEIEDINTLLHELSPLIMSGFEKIYVGEIESEGDNECLCHVMWEETAKLHNMNYNYEGEWTTHYLSKSF